MKLVMIALTLLMSFSSIVNAGSCGFTISSRDSNVESKARFFKATDNTNGETYYYVDIQGGPGNIDNILGWNWWENYHVYHEAYIDYAGFESFDNDIEPYVYYYTATSHYSDFNVFVMNGPRQWRNRLHIQGDGMGLNYRIFNWGLRSKSGFKKIGSLELIMRTQCID